MCLSYDDLVKIQNMETERLEDASMRPAGAYEAMGLLEISAPICCVCTDGVIITDFMDACERELERRENENE